MQGSSECLALMVLMLKQERFTKTTAAATP
jgi:hypothetical protein